MDPGLMLYTCYWLKMEHSFISIDEYGSKIHAWYVMRYSDQKISGCAVVWRYDGEILIISKT